MTTTAAMPRLDAATTPAARLLHGRALLSTGIVHLGVGNFHRAHQAVHTAAALAAEDGPWGILGVASRSAAVATRCAEQDLRYAVVELSPEQTRIVGAGRAHGRAGGRPRARGGTGRAGRPSTRIVTLTVTEHGYTFSPRTRPPDLDHAGVRADLRGDAPPRTTLGLIVRGLQRGPAPPPPRSPVLSCDNLASNGATTARLVAEFAAALPAAEYAELAPFSPVSRSEQHGRPHRAGDHRHLPGRRGRPAPACATRSGARRAVQHVGHRGRVRRRPAGLGARRCPVRRRRRPYELLKLRLLNGTHSMIAYLGALAARRPFRGDRPAGHPRGGNAGAA